MNNILQHIFSNTIEIREHRLFVNEQHVGTLISKRPLTTFIINKFLDKLNDAMEQHNYLATHQGNYVWFCPDQHSTIRLLTHGDTQHHANLLRIQDVLSVSDSNRLMFDGKLCGQLFGTPILDGKQITSYDKTIGVVTGKPWNWRASLFVQPLGVKL